MPMTLEIAAGSLGEIEALMWLGGTVDSSVPASFFAAMIAETSFAAVGFGSAMLYEIAWQLCIVLGLVGGDRLEEAVANINVMELPCSIVQLVAMRKHFRPGLTLLWNTPFVAVLPLGTLVLVNYGKNVWLKRLLGGVFLFIVVLQLYKRWRSPQQASECQRPALDSEDRSVSSLVAVWAAMAFSGFTRGLFGVSGPPVMVLLLLYNFQVLETWRCLAAANVLLGVIVQLAFFALSEDSPFKAVSWPMYVALMLGGLTGLGLGNTLAPHIHAKAFQSWLLFFLTAGAALMVCEGYRTASTVVAFVIGDAFLIAALLSAFFGIRRITASARQGTGPCVESAPELDS